MSKLTCVLYTAEWCEPCKAFKKKYWPKLKAEFPGVDFPMVDIDQDFSDRTITSIPTIRIYKGKRQLRTFRDVVGELDAIKDLLLQKAFDDTKSL